MSNTATRRAAAVADKNEYGVSWIETDGETAFQAAASYADAERIATAAAKTGGTQVEIVQILARVSVETTVKVEKVK